MRRGEIWWAQLPGPAKTRPVLLIGRDESYQLRTHVTVATVTSKIRGILSEVRVGREDGLRRECAVNLDDIQTIAKSAIKDRLTALDDSKLAQVHEAIRFALALP